MHRKFIDYLQKTRTDEADKEISMQNAADIIVQNQMDSALKKIQSRFNRSESSLDMLEARSTGKSHSYSASRISRKSKSSSKVNQSLSAIIIQQKAKAEVAKLRQQYVQQEVELEMKQVALQAELKLLNSKKHR